MHSWRVKSVLNTGNSMHEDSLLWKNMAGSENTLEFMFGAGMMAVETMQGPKAHPMVGTAGGKSGQEHCVTPRQPHPPASLLFLRHFPPLPATSLYGQIYYSLLQLCCVGSEPVSVVF